MRAAASWVVVLLYVQERLNEILEKYFSRILGIETRMNYASSGINIDGQLHMRRKCALKDKINEIS